MRKKKREKTRSHLHRVLTYRYLNLALVLKIGSKLQKTIAPTKEVGIARFRAHLVAKILSYGRDCSNKKLNISQLRIRLLPRPLIFSLSLFPSFVPPRLKAPNI